MSDINSHPSPTSFEKCNHVFVTKEKKKYASRIGTHHAGCKFCDLSFMEFGVTNIIAITHKKMLIRFNENIPKNLKGYILHPDDVCCYDGDLYPQKCCVRSEHFGKECRKLE